MKDCRFIFTIADEISDEIYHELEEMVENVGVEGVMKFFEDNNIALINGRIVPRVYEGE